jgi:hypothetical protein
MNIPAIRGAALTTSFDYLAKKEYKSLSYGACGFFSDYSLGNWLGPALDGLRRVG